jgi:hypothetical protein
MAQKASWQSSLLLLLTITWRRPVTQSELNLDDHARGFRVVDPLLFAELFTDLFLKNSLIARQISDTS